MPLWIRNDSPICGRKDERISCVGSSGGVLPLTVVVPVIRRAWLVPASKMLLARPMPSVLTNWRRDTGCSECAIARGVMLSVTGFRLLDTLQRIPTISHQEQSHHRRRIVVALVVRVPLHKPVHAPIVDPGKSE